MILDPKKLTGWPKIVSFFGLSATGFLALMGLFTNSIGLSVFARVLFGLAGLAFIGLLIVARQFPENSPPSEH
jgi:hypothetical protein